MRNLIRNGTPTVITATARKLCGHQTCSASPYRDVLVESNESYCASYASNCACDDDDDDDIIIIIIIIIVFCQEFLLPRSSDYNFFYT
jgi:hypothetical protein